MAVFHRRGRLVLSCLLLLALFSEHAMSASTVNAASSNAASYLLSKQNTQDGSWGADPDVKYVLTTEVVQALNASNQLSPQYYAGLAWLNNNQPTNNDFVSRRVLSTGSAGSAVAADVQSIANTQNISSYLYKGWGINTGFEASPMDTALSLLALNSQGNTTGASNAISYLASVQLTGTDTGWSLAKESNSDPISTALAIQALTPYKATNTSAATAVSKGLTALNAKVTTSSPVSQIALAYIANYQNNGSSTQATNLLNALLAQQAVDGSWSGDVYTTALSMRALAVSQGKDLAAQKQGVNIPDNNLRKAINAALGRGAMDALNVGQLGQLYSLNASGLGIQDLTGLQYAGNLTSLDVSNNQINSFTPIASLNIPILNVSNNPGTAVAGGGSNSGDVPLPPWIIALFAIGLLFLIRKQTLRR